MDPVVAWKKKDVQSYLLSEFAAAEKRRKRARTDTSRAKAVGAKQTINGISVALFGKDLEQIESGE